MPVAPYGSWPSPVTAESLVARSLLRREIATHGEELVWVEGRPEEGGRQVVVRWDPPGPVDVMPAGSWSARSTVHEYGGGAVALHGTTVFFVNADDQRVWRLDRGQDPVPLTPAPDRERSVRFADLDVHPDGSRLACVRERHLVSGEVVNDLVIVATDGAGEPVEPTLAAGGRHFYAAPRFGPLGGLAWLCWDHPNMPWDGTELWTGDGRVAGGPSESVSQPRWSPDGRLAWVSDRTGWWNLYLGGTPMAAEAAEFSGPDWAFGQRTYAFVSEGRVMAVRTAVEGQRLVVLDPDGRRRELDLPYVAVDSVHAWGDGIVAVASSPTESPAVVAIDCEGDVEVLRRSRPDGTVGHGAVSEGAVSVAEPVSFPTAGGAEWARAHIYPPANAEWSGPAEARPPLIVTCHGGPTGQAGRAYNADVQFWTSRGFAVADVDHRGSSGYGRPYRDRLAGGWGVVDVEDCVAAAVHLADEGLVDRRRMVIRGRSAGGLTVLNALRASDVFAAGASSYGVTDLATLVAETHKFEARYFDRLVGPWPAAADVYAARSPCRHAADITVPVLLLHGSDDHVVPPAQAAGMAAGLRSAGVPCAMVLFEGEGHGFRRAETIVRAAEVELWFYGQVLGFEPHDQIDPVPIDPVPKSVTRPGGPA